MHRTRAVHRFTETPNRSISLFLRNSGRKTVSHFSWNCSRSLFFRMTLSEKSATFRDHALAVMPTQPVDVIRYGVLDVVFRLEAGVLLQPVDVEVVVRRAVGIAPL